MDNCNFRIVFALVAALICSSYCHTEHEFNSGAYKLVTETNFTSRTVEFHLTVKTLGWVGVGVGPNSYMPGADLVVGGVQNGIAYYKDMHALINGPPTNDTKTTSDWVLIRVSENVITNETVISFTRLFKTSDPNPGQDFEIKNEELYVLMAYGLTDTFGFHQNNSKSERVNLRSGENQTTTTLRPNITTTTLRPNITTTILRPNITTTTLRPNITTTTLRPNITTTTLRPNITTTTLRPNITTTTLRPNITTTTIHPNSTTSRPGGSTTAGVSTPSTLKSLAVVISFFIALAVKLIP